MRGVLGQVAVGAALALALTGCGSDAPPPPKIAGESSTPTPTPKATGTPSGPGTTRPKPADLKALDDTGHDVYRGTIVTSSDKQQVVVDAWLAYWKVRLADYFSASYNLDDLAGVATGSALSQVTSYADFLKSKGRHTVGDVLVNIDHVRMHGQSATLTSCMRNTTRDHDRRTGRPVEPLDPFFTFHGALTHHGGTWLVSDLTVANHSPCL